MLVYQDKVIFKKIDQFSKARTIQADFNSKEARKISLYEEALLRQEPIVGMSQEDVERCWGKLDKFNSKITPSGIKIIYVDKIKEADGREKKISKVLRIKDGVLIKIDDY